ncbi:lipopolysaccharide biosynthesis protein [Luteibacter yeojuensis]
MYRRLLTNSARTTAVLGLRILSQGIVLLVLARALGSGDYGALAALSSLAVVLGVLPNFGAGFVLLRRSHDRSAWKDVLDYSIPTTLVIGGFLTVVYTVAAPWLTGTNVSTTVIACIGVAELLITPLAMLAAYTLQADDKVPLGQLVQWLPAGMKVIAACIAWLAPPPQRLLVYAMTQLLFTAIGLCIGWRITSRTHPIRLHPRAPHRSELRDGGAYVPMHLVAANPSEIDKIVGVQALGPEAGIYAAATRLMAAAVTPVTAVLLTLQPRLFRSGVESPATRRHLIRLTAVAALVCGVVAAACVVAISGVIVSLLGPSFAPIRQTLFWIAPVAPILALRQAAGTLLMAEGHPMMRLAFELTGTLVLLLALVVLGRLYGLAGASVGLFIAEAIMAIIGWLAILSLSRRD